MRARRLSAILGTAVVSLLGGLVLGACVVGPLIGTTARPVPAPVATATTSANDTAAAGTAPAPPTASPASPPPVRPSATPAPTLPPSIPNEIPILYYHRVEAPPAGFATWSLAQRQTFMADNVLPGVFAAQLDWLAGHGYHTILPRDLVAHWDRAAQLPARPIILTFDDGWADWATNVVPLLRSHHMVAEFYVVVDQVGPRGVTWAELRAFAAAGMGIGAHDVHHVQLAGLGNTEPPASPATMWYEVSEARRIIGANVGVLPDSMAYVGGGFDPTLVGLVRRAGYTTARSILRGVLQPSQWRYELHVSRIGGYDDVKSVVSGAFDPALPTFERRVTGLDPG